MAATASLYCSNHPQTETLLRCIRCEKPYCVKCLVRTPVGLTCRACLNQQQSGFYTATVADHTVAAVIGVIASVIAGAIAAALAGLWLIAIFYAPFAGGVIGEIIRRAIQNRRGQYVAPVAVAAVFIGSAIGTGVFALITLLVGRGGLAIALAAPLYALRYFFSIGFLVYLVLVIGTVYARLRN